jgi:hypothetical protein
MQWKTLCCEYFMSTIFSYWPYLLTATYISFSNTIYEALESRTSLMSLTFFSNFYNKYQVFEVIYLHTEKVRFFCRGTVFVHEIKIQY